MKDLPNSPEAERALLGILLSKPKQLPSDVAALTEDDFYRASHRTLYKAIASLYLEGKTADMVTVTESLRASGKLDAVGGIAFITSLAADILSLQNMDEYIAVLREKRRLRHLARVFDELAKEACKGAETADHLLERCQRATENAQEVSQPILFHADCKADCHAPRFKFVAISTASDFKTLICKAATVLGDKPATSSLAFYSLGLYSCSEMNAWLRENLLQRSICLDTVRLIRIFLSDSELSFLGLLASLRSLRRLEGERLFSVIMDTWMLFQANTLSPAKVARMVSGLRKLADELDISITLAIHAPSSDDFPKLGIVC